jgi:hypothetical protein
MEHYVPTDVDSVLRQVGKEKEVDNQDGEDELEYEPVGKGKKGAGASAFPIWALTAFEKIRRNKISLMVLGYILLIFA